MKRFMCVFALPVFLLASPCLSAAPVKAASPAPAADATGIKLDKVLQNQLEILRQLEEIKKELAIVKARATR